MVAVFQRTFSNAFFNENIWISITISLKFVPEGPINNIQSLVQIMTWHWSGDQPLLNQWWPSLLTHICITRPEWVTMCLIHMSFDANNTITQTWIYNFYVLGCSRSSRHYREEYWHFDLIHKSQNAHVPYPTMLHSEQKCAYFCSEWSIVWYGTVHSGICELGQSVSILHDNAYSTSSTLKLTKSVEYQPPSCFLYRKDINRNDIGCIRLWKSLRPRDACMRQWTWTSYQCFR